MGTYNLTNLVCETASLPDPYSWVSQQKILISTGAWMAGGTAGVTRISFKAPTFLNKNIKVTIQVKGIAETYQNAKYSSMTLSQIEYGARSIANSTGNWHNDISTTLANNRIGQTVTGVLSGTNVSFTLSNIALASNTTYYLYFVRKGAPMNYDVPASGWQYATESGYAAALNASNVSVSLQMEISQLDTPVITTAKKVLPYSEEGETVTINWEGVSSKTNNTLKNYRVYLRVGSKPTASSYKILKETTSTSCDFSLAGIGRASKVYIGVQAVSQYDEYKETQASIFGNCNSSIATLYLGDLNSLPTAPTLTKTGSVVSGNQSVDFTNFSSTDVDGQTLTYYYELNGGDKIKITGSPLKLSLTLEGLMELGISNTGSYTINFFAFDTQEYSIEKAVTFRAEFAPVITGREFDVILVEATDNKKAISSMTLSYTLQYEFSDLTPKVYVYNKTGENTFADPWILEPEYYTVDGKNIIVKPKDMPLDKIDYGTYFKVRFEVLNSSGLSSGLGADNDASEVYRRPYMIPESKFPTMEVMNDAAQKGDSWSKYFKDYLTITVGEITLDPYYPVIEKITLLTRDKNNKLRTATFKVGDNIAKLNNAVPNPGDWCTLGLRLTDSVGQTIERNFSDKYYRVEGLSFNNGNYSISRGSINPCIEDQSFDITHPIAVSNKGDGNIPISYSYKYSIKNQEIAIVVTSETLNDVTIQATTKNTEEFKEFEVFKEVVKNVVDPKTNFQGNGTITITAKDAFNQTATYSGLVLETNTKTAPSFGTSSNFILRHNYDIDRDLTTQAIEIGNSEVTDYNPEIFNSGEKIVFQIPKPTDVNEDITNLKFYLYRNDLPEVIQDIKRYSEIEFDKIAWLTIPISSFSSDDQDNDYYYYNYTTSPYSKNEYFYFKITAVDSLGAESLALTNSHYIIGARTVPSQIKVTSNSAQIEQSEDNSKAIVKLDLNLEILDLGGSAGLVDNKVSWDTGYYNKYPNFNRAAYYSNDNKPRWVNMIDYKWVQVEISPTADFSSEEVRVKREQLETLGEEWEINNLKWEFTDFKGGANRVYVRVRLLVPYALTDTNSTSVTRAQVQGTPFIFSFFDQSPTVAYRPHQIGINVKKVNENAVLEISQFNNYKQVILKRDSDKSIVIDIDKMTIDGIIIEGGSW